MLSRLLEAWVWRHMRMGSCQETNDHEAVVEGWIVQREGAPGWSCETHHRLEAVQTRIYLQRPRRRA